MPVAEQVPDSVSLTALSGDVASLDDWLTTFQLAVVVIDPYTSESAWILDTAGAILTEFKGADCRVGWVVTADLGALSDVAWVVTADAKDARTFLGPWADELLTFCDADRSFVKGVGLGSLPAFVHLRQDRVVVSAVEGWDPAGWDTAVGTLTQMMSWSKVEVPPPGAPAAFAGSPA